MQIRFSFLLGVLLAFGPLANGLRADSFIVPFTTGVVEREVFSFTEFDTQFTITDLGDSEITAAFQFFDASGIPAEVQARDVNGIPVVLPHIRPGGYACLQVSSQGNESKAGWMMISTSGPASVRVSTDYAHVDTSEPPSTLRGRYLLARVGFFPLTLTTRAVAPVQYSAWESTGVSIVFPSGGENEAHVLLTLKDEEGQTLGIASVDIVPNGQTTKSLEELIPGIKNRESAILEVTSDVAVCIFGVFYQRDPLLYSEIRFDMGP
ncbi:MAG: hypothetical protein P8020_20765 [Acidobacteriota bacterium]